MFPNFLLVVLKYGVNYYLFEAIRTKHEICIKNDDEDSVNYNCQLTFVFFFHLERGFKPANLAPVTLPSILYMCVCDYKLH